MKKKFLVLIANSSEAQLFDAAELRSKDVLSLAKFAHPKSREKVSDLVTDKAGFVQNHGVAANAYEGKHNPKEVEAEHFAEELVKSVTEFCQKYQRSDLLFVAPAHFYNWFKKHWHHHNINIEYLGKDYTKLNARELTLILRKHFELPD
ncbi:MAG: host attachment protein [Gammaproteobacteria bacterium]